MPLSASTIRKALAAMPFACSNALNLLNVILLWLCRDQPDSPGIEPLSLRLMQCLQSTTKQPTQKASAEDEAAKVRASARPQACAHAANCTRLSILVQRMHEACVLHAASHTCAYAGSLATCSPLFTAVDALTNMVCLQLIREKGLTKLSGRTAAHNIDAPEADVIWAAHKATETRLDLRNFVYRVSRSFSL